MSTLRRITLEAPAPDGVRRFVAELPKNLSLDGEAPTNWVTVTKLGHFYDPRYGEFDITREMCLAMIENFNKGTYGQDIFLDVAHKPSDGAAAKFIKLALEGNKLRALLEWTPFGVDAVKNRGFKYLSADYSENFQDNEKRAQHGPLLFGAGLTIRPVIKGLDPVRLSEPDDAPPTFLHPDLQTHLLQEIQIMHKQLAEKLKTLLAGIIMLSEPMRAQLLAAFETAVKPVTDEVQAKALMEEFAASGKTLGEMVVAGQKDIKLSIGGPAGLTAEDVQRILAEDATAKATAAKQLAEGKAANVKLLTDTINAAPGFDDGLKKKLAEGVADLITAGMSPEQVKMLAANQIAHGNELSVARQLAAQGYAGPAGRVHIDMLDDSAKKLSGMVREKLKLTRKFATGELKLAENDHPYTKMILDDFDRRHGVQLAEEAKLLSGGQANTGDYYMPAAIQREVIRVALSDLNVLNLVNVNTDPNAQSTTEIPYEVRPDANIANDGQVYEGQPIPRYQIGTAYETAFITPTKLGLEYTNELNWFGSRSLINWDANANNLAANARLVREMITRRLANEMQRASDSYAAQAIVDENIAAQLAGANSLIKTSVFPVVRPLQVKNLKGVAQGAEENPIEVVVNTAVIPQFNGTGTQAAGTYWKPVSFNMGYIQLVTENGVTPVTPVAATACTISYSKATNIVLVDMDVPNGDTLEKHLNNALRAVGSRKAMLSGQRYVTPDYLLMSPTLNDTLSNAEQFINEFKRNGTDSNDQGDLMKVKGINAYGTNQPGIDLGDERIIMAPRNLVGYTIAKPYSVEGAPFEVVDVNGNAIGKKQIYAEEYNAIHTPTPVRKYLTSVLCYSAAGR